VVLAEDERRVRDGDPVAVRELRPLGHLAVHENDLPRIEVDDLESATLPEPELRLTFAGAPVIEVNLRPRPVADHRALADLEGAAAVRPFDDDELRHG